MSCPYQSINCGTKTIYATELLFFHFQLFSDFCNVEKFFYTVLIIPKIGISKIGFQTKAESYTDHVKMRIDYGSTSNRCQ